MIVVMFYFIISIYFGRKNPLFYLLLPIALQQGPAAFIDQSFAIGGKKVFSVYETIFIDVLFFLLIVISVFLIKAKLPRINNIGSGLIFGYLVYIFILFFSDLLSYKNSSEVVLTTRDFLYIGLNYILWLAIFQAVSRNQFEGFLKLLFYITPVSSILYILNSSGIFSLFPKELIYSEVDYESSSFLRDFVTIPLFLSPVVVLCVQSLLMQIVKIPRYLFLLNVILLPVALLFTFTRSLVIAVLMQIGFILILRCFKDGWNGVVKAIVFVFVFSACFAPVYLLADRIFPDQVNYLTSRFVDASKEGKNEQNVDLRLAYLDEAREITKYTSPTYGAGMNREYYQQMNNIGAWKADSTIPFFLYHTGWLGIAVLYFILLYFSIDSAILYFRTGDWLVAFLSSEFFAFSISSMIMGGLQLNAPLWFLNLALYTTIKFNLWKPIIVYTKTPQFKNYLAAFSGRLS